MDSKTGAQTLSILLLYDLFLAMVIRGRSAAPKRPANMAFNPYGGKMGEIPATNTPFPHRAGYLWKIQYATNWDEDGDEAARHYIELTRKLYRYMTPFVSKNPRAAFLTYGDLDLGVNHNGDESYEEGKVYGVKYFKGNFDRFVEIKTKVDPGNFFRNEQSIPVLPGKKEGTCPTNYCTFLGPYTFCTSSVKILSLYDEQSRMCEWE